MGVLSNRHRPVGMLLVTRIAGLEEALRGRALPGVTWQRTKTDADTALAIPQAVVIVADPPLVAPHLKQASRLRWLQSTHAGVDSLMEAGSGASYILTRLVGPFGPMMAEYVLGHMLARERGLVELARQQEARRWQPSHYRVLAGLTLGILGAGSIGQVVAGAAKAFGMTVWGLRSRPLAAPNIDRLFTPAQLVTFLSGPDYLVSVLPSTAATRGLLSGEVLKACRPEAVLINIGRGDVIDEASLVRALTEGWLAGAVLDVFEEEPLPAESPLWELPGVTITPHVAALGGAEDIADAVAANVTRYVAGQPLEHQVDWERAY